MSEIIPRIQFRLSKVNDQDLIQYFSRKLKDATNDMTTESKRLMRLGIQHDVEDLHVVVIPEGSYRVDKPISGRNTLIVIEGNKQGAY